MDRIPVVFAANNKYAPVFATCFQSLLNNSNPQRSYEVVLLHKNISPRNRGILLSMAEKYPNVSLRIVDVLDIVSKYDLKAGGHISTETYYRFLIQDILPEYDKVLYIDVDTIIEDDVAKLYDTDLDRYMLAAVRDVDFLGQIGGASEKTIQYCKDDFHMIDPHNYFQAGVILFNERKMREEYSLNQWLSFASKKYMYNDQDVLNLYCENKVMYLDMSWNVVNDCDHCRINNIIRFAPDEIRNEYMLSREHPRIIHYAGHIKPWNNPQEDFADNFWRVFEQTPYSKKMATKFVWKKNYYSRVILNKLLPHGTKRRELIKKII